ILAVLTAASRAWRRVVLPAAVAALFILLAPNLPRIRSTAEAATITVDNTDDDVAAGHCTLREAINDANGTGPTGNCTPAGNGFDAITFGSGVTGPIGLASSSLPAVHRNLTIYGGGAITVNGATHYQVFVVNPGATLTLDDLAVFNG